MADVKQEIVEMVLNNPNAQMIVASSTVSVPIINTVMDWAPNVITIVGGSLGIILTAMMITHKYIQIKNDLNPGDRNA